MTKDYDLTLMPDDMRDIPLEHKIWATLRPDVRAEICAAVNYSNKPSEIRASSERAIAEVRRLYCA